LRVSWTPDGAAAWDARLCAPAGGEGVAARLRRGGLPARLADALCAEAGLAAGARMAELRREQRGALVRALTAYALPVTGHEVGSPPRASARCGPPSQPLPVAARPHSRCLRPCPCICSRRARLWAPRLVPHSQPCAASLVKQTWRQRRAQGYAKAEVTGGGLPLEEVDCATLESRLRPGLFVCGELVDVWGRVGGYCFLWACPSCCCLLPCSSTRQTRTFALCWLLGTVSALVPAAMRDRVRARPAQAWLSGRLAGLSAARA